MSAALPEIKASTSSPRQPVTSLRPGAIIRQNCCMSWIQTRYRIYDGLLKTIFKCLKRGVDPRQTYVFCRSFSVGGNLL